MVCKELTADRLCAFLAGCIVIWVVVTLLTSWGVEIIAIGLYVVLPLCSIIVLALLVALCRHVRYRLQAKREFEDLESLWPENVSGTSEDV